MRHLMLFEDFTTDVFRSANAAIEEDVLVPLETLMKRGHSQLPKPKELANAVKLMGLEPDAKKYFYYNPNGIIEPIIYWDGEVYVGFPGGNVTKEFIEMMQVPKRIEKGKEMYKAAVEEGKWSRLFLLIDQKVAIPMYIRNYDKIPDKDKYELFVDIYQNSEYGFEQFPDDMISDLMDNHAKNSPERRKRMARFKKDARKNDDGTVTIYRGQNTESTDEDEAYSWTLSRDTAEFFANRFKMSGEVVQKDVRPEDVVDYLTSRNESEVILKPKRLR